jgi:hypothetical protein
VDIFTKILTEVGPWAALALLLLWWIHKQLAKQDAANAKTISRLQATEDWIRKTLVDTTNRVTDALADNAHAMREAVQAQRDTQRTNREILIALRGRPCMHDADLPDAAVQPPTEPIVRKGRDHA